MDCEGSVLNIYENEPLYSCSFHSKNMFHTKMAEMNKHCPKKTG